MISVLAVLAAFIAVLLLMGHGKYRWYVLAGIVVLAVLVYVLTGIPNFDQGGGLVK